MRHLRLILAAAGIAALACSGSDSPSAPTGGGSSTVTVGTPAGGLTFSPTNITVAPNGTVTWNWNSGGVIHDVTFSDGSSGPKSSGTFQKTFPTAGTFNYHCSIHGQAMSGTVTVSSSSGDNGGGTGGGSGGGGGGGGAYP
jgi:plastocyanin